MVYRRASLRVSVRSFSLFCVSFACFTRIKSLINVGTIHHLFCQARIFWVTRIHYRRGI